MTSTTPRFALAAPVAALCGILVFALAGQVLAPIVVGSLGLNSPVSAQIVLKTLMFILVVALMRWDGRPLREFGLSRPLGSSRWGRWSAAALVLGAAASAALLASPAEGMTNLRTFGLLDLVLWIWLWSSWCEEILTRGLVQTWVRNRGAFLGISLPVWAAAVTFGLLHTALIGARADLWTVGIVVFSTTLLGLLCGLARERTGSLIPAFVTHFAFNLGGFLGGLALFLLGFAGP